MRRPVTPMAVRRAGFVLDRDHDRDANYHQWVYLPAATLGEGAVVRDWLGRKLPDHRMGHVWIRLICNNTDCRAIALHRVAAIEAAAERYLPTPHRHQPAEPDEPTPDERPEWRQLSIDVREAG